MKAGPVNIYEGPCRHQLVTIDRDEGVTPMFKACPQCGARLHSTGYPIGAQSATPTHEWYRPSPKAARRMGPEMEQYVKAGGLAFRPITPRGDQ